VTEVLIATDADAVFDEVDAALADESTRVVRVRSGFAVADVVAESAPDLVVLDLQIGNMGGMATCMEIRLEAGAGRLCDPGVLMLLDRAADVFLAQRCDADGWLIKPLDAFRLRRAADAIIRGGTYREGVPAEPEVSPPEVEDEIEPAEADAEVG
jgi:DNA-binding response OmpR family regulator